jgi:hypothetical protein
MTATDRRQAATSDRHQSLLFLAIESPVAQLNPEAAINALVRNG